MTTHQHLTDRQAYEHYVGTMTPEEFVKKYGDNSINVAVDEFLKHWNHPEPVPDWLDAALFRHIEDVLDQTPITRHSFQFESLDFDMLSDEQQEEALRQLLRRMTFEQKKQALLIVQEFVLADKVEQMCLRSNEAGYQTASETDVKNTADEVRQFIEGHESN